MSQKNQGLGEARNTGMKMVETPFTTFLDSDDWLDTRYVENFTKTIERLEYEPDLVFELPWVYNSVTKWVFPWYDKNLYDNIFEVKDGVSSTCTNAASKPELYALEVSACRKIIRTGFLRELDFSFPKGLKWEDVPGHFYMLHEANSCVAMPEASFFYRTETGTSITTGIGKSNLDMPIIFDQLLDIKDRLEFEPEESSYVIKIMARFSMWRLDLVSNEYIDQLLYELHKNFLRISEDEINYYLERRCGECDREEHKGFIMALRSKDYLKLKDSVKRDDVILIYANGGKRNLFKTFKTGMKMIRERGLSYTAKRTVKKFILKKV